MRKLTLITAAAGTALVFAAPAAAQYAPAPQGHAYGYNNYGQAYGYNNYGQVRSMQARINGIQRQIERLGARRMITRNEANGLRSESRNIERRLSRAARYGLNWSEARDIESRIGRLERHVAREVRDGRRYGNGYNGYGYNNAYYNDNDRDGRNDNDEHDRWHDQHDD